MRKPYYYFFAFLLYLPLQAQRYLTDVFANVDLTSNVQYGQAPAVSGVGIPLSLDIYTPQGDNLTNRPLMVLAHGGSFVAGNRTDTYMVAICEYFARKGYVTASISYRLGINFANIGEIDKELTRAAVRAIQDHSAAVRFFYQSARDNGNPYGIDTNRLIAGGVSAGSIAAVHSQLFWDENTASPTTQQIVNQLGGINGGNSGAAGFPNRAIGLFEVIGAILDTQMVNTPDVATISFHGTADDVVPYGVGFATFNGAPILQMHGSSVLIQRLQNMGATAEMNTFPGVDHDIFSDPVRTDTIMQRATRFFYREVVNNPSVGTLSLNQETIQLYPNPVQGDVLFLELPEPMSYRLMDVLGKEIQQGKWAAGQQRLDVSQLPKGIYLLQLPGQTHRIIRQ